MNPGANSSPPPLRYASSVDSPQRERSAAGATEGAEGIEENLEHGAGAAFRWIWGSVRSGFLLPLEVGYLLAAGFGVAVATTAFVPDMLVVDAVARIEGSGLDATFRSLWIAVDSSGLFDLFLVVPVLGMLPLFFGVLWAVVTLLHAVSRAPRSWARRLTWTALVLCAVLVPLVAGGVVIERHRGIGAMDAALRISAGALLALLPLSAVTLWLLSVFDRVERQLETAIQRGTGSAPFEAPH